MANKLFSLLAVLFLLSADALADGLIVITPPVVRSPVPITPLEIRQHLVSAKIKDQVATTEVDQIFYNPNNVRLEGTYIFPIPQGAHIDHFSMDIGGKMTDAELLDADKAKQIYEDIVRRMQDPALLEYIGQGMFKLRIFPIEPRSEKRIKLTYTELLTSDNNLTNYRYPLNTEKFSSTPLNTVSMKVELASSVDLTSIYSPSHEVEIKRSGGKEAVVGYEAKNIKPDQDFQLFFGTAKDAGIGLNMLGYNDGTDPEGGYFALLASPREEKAAETLPKDITFVVDTSGSMADGNRIGQAKKALTFCLRNLNRNDRFEIVRFSTEAEPFFKEVVDASPENVERAVQFVDSLKPVGGTAIEEALIKALEEAPAASTRPYMIIFLTDGSPTIGKTNEDEITADVVKAAGAKTVRIFSFGIGTEINTHLLDKLSTKMRGATEYIMPTEDLEIKVSNFYSKVSEPVLADLKIRFGDNVTVSKMQPSPLPDLFRGQQLSLFGRYRGNGATAVFLEGTVNGEKKTYTYETTFPAKAVENEFIPKLWATRRVGYLLEQIRLNGENKELRDEATELAKKYGIVTPYTAYLIVEDEAQRGVPVNQRMLSAPEGGVAEKLRQHFDVRKSKGGADAVLGAKTEHDLSSASVERSAEMKAAAAPDLDKETGGYLVKQRGKFVSGKMFYERQGVWHDAEVQKHAAAPREKIRFGSEEYFSFLSKHPQSRKWLALGKNVQIFFDGKVFEIYE